MINSRNLSKPFDFRGIYFIDALNLVLKKFDPYGNPQMGKYEAQPDKRSVNISPT